MVAKKTTGRRGGKKLGLKRETLRDLDPKSKGKNIKAGKGPETASCDSCSPVCTVACNFSLVLCRPAR
ncbi:MAG TPA: hypothetical protein VF376_01835 [Thermoanaerobaculia bacterium]